MGPISTLFFFFLSQDFIRDRCIWFFGKWNKWWGDKCAALWKLPSPWEIVSDYSDPIWSQIMSKPQNAIEISAFITLEYHKYLKNSRFILYVRFCPDSDRPACSADSSLKSLQGPSESPQSCALTTALGKSVCNSLPRHSFLCFAF